MTSPPVPPQAITAAAEAIQARYGQRGRLIAPAERWAAELAEVVLEAAAPHLAPGLDEAQAAAYATGVTDGAAAEREKLAAWLDGPEAAAVTANAIRAQVDEEIAGAQWAGSSPPPADRFQS